MFFRRYTTISKKTAEHVVEEWIPYIRRWLMDSICDKKRHRDIGKMLSGPTEDYVNSYIERVTKRKIKSVVGLSYDGITDDEKKVIRHQIKFRKDKWTLNTTRSSDKQYRASDFDMLAIYVPAKDFSLKGGKIVCIPANELLCKSKDKMVSCANKLKIKYEKKDAEDVLKDIYM